MNIYLLSQTRNQRYDTYDSAVVAAASEEEARKTDVAGAEGGDPEIFGWVRPEFVAVRLLGVANPGTEAGVILASFNAG